MDHLAFEETDEQLTTVRDSLYDRITLRPREVALLGTPEFLRLDGIKQLGFVSRVWPGAKHSRFEHSLGVLALVRRALDTLRPALAATLQPRPSDLDAIAAAALLHDIGHYPFSHGIEELGPPVLRHEEVGRSIVENGAVADVLEREWGLDPRRVANLIEPREPLPPIDALLVGLLSGTLDMDKLDYLPRDAKACNVPYGRVDAPRLLASLEVAPIAGTLRIVMGDKGVSPLHSLINARQEMFDNVYWHHTSRACMVMLLRAVQDALLADAATPLQLTKHDDASLLALLARDTMPPSTYRLVELLRLRQIHKRAVEISARAGALYETLGALYYRPDRRRELELELAAALAEATGEVVADYDVLIDIPKPEKWTTDVWVHFARPPVGFESLMHWQDVVGLGDDDFKRYEEHRRLIRIVATERLRDAVRRHWDDVVLPRIMAFTTHPRAPGEAMARDWYRVVAAVHLFLIRDGQVLLLRRFNTGYEDGQYSVIAGHLDGDEEITAAMRREAHEEAGIEIAPESLRVVGVMHRKSTEERIDFFLTATAWSGEITNREPTKCDQLAWFDLDRLPENVIPYVRRALESYRRGGWFDSFGWT